MKLQDAHTIPLRADVVERKVASYSAIETLCLKLLSETYLDREILAQIT